MPQVQFFIVSVVNLIGTLKRTLNKMLFLFLFYGHYLLKNMIIQYLNNQKSYEN